MLIHVKLDSIECKLTPTTFVLDRLQLKYVYAFCDPVTLTFDLLT